MLKSHLILEPSATVAVNTLALQKRARGERVYNLSAGEPVLLPHPEIIKGAEQAMKAGKTLYPPVAGIPELRAAAANWMNANYGTNYQTNHTLVTCGGKFGVFAACQALIAPGDEALIIAPYWVSYPEIVKLFGGIPRIIQTEEKNGWKISRSDLDKIETKIKIFILNNGANPTGALYPRDEIKSILAWAKKNNIVVISDEVYSGLVYDEGEYVSAGSFPEHQDHVIVVQSCSKHFAMTGWRVGFVFGPEEIIIVLTTLQSQSTTGTSSIGQWAAVAAFEHAAEIIPAVRGAMQTRRDTLMQSLEKYFGRPFKKPASSLYAFVSLKNLRVATNNSVEFCRRLIEEHNIAAVPGGAFGIEGYVRFSFGETEQELRQAVKVLRTAITK